MRRLMPNKRLRWSDGDHMLAPEPRVTRALKWTFGVMLALTAVLVASVVLWVLNPTRAYYKPISTSIQQADDGRWIASVTRELPRGDFRARWGLTVWVKRGEASFVCAEPMSHVADYQAERGPTVAYELPLSVSRCMNEAPPISLTWTRQAMAWGWLPMRPMTTTITLDPDVQRASEDG